MSVADFHKIRLYSIILQIYKIFLKKSQLLHIFNFLIKAMNTIDIKSA